MMPPGPSNAGFILAVASAVAYCSHSIGVRLFVGDLTVWGILFLRGLMGFVVATLVARHLKKNMWGRNKLLLAGIGFSGFLSAIGILTAVATIPLYQALVILYLYPALSLLLAVPLNHEPITSRSCFLIAVALTGCAILLWPDEAVGLTLEIGHLICLAGSFFFSLTTVLTRRLGDDNSGLEPIYHYSLHTVLGVIPLAFLFGSDLGLTTLRGVGVGLALSTLGFSGHIMCYAALRWLPAYRVGLIGTLEIFLATLASWLLFNDPMSPRALFGGALIIFVVLMLNRPPAPTNQRGPTGRFRLRPDLFTSRPKS